SYNFELFSDLMPAYQAQLVGSVLYSVSNLEYFIFGVVVGFLFVLCERFFKLNLPVIPMAFGIGLFLGPNLGILLGLGGIVRNLVESGKKSYSVLGVVFAAGLMGGESFADIISKSLHVFGFGSYSWVFLLLLFLISLFLLLN
ncbi:MAG: OPT/YSL family transporter, partial [Candidatus Diapherotrites archaeon]